MKICALLAAFLLLCSFNNGKNINVSSGLYKNSKMEYELKSAYAGGAVADPTKGSSFRLRLYDITFENDITPKNCTERVFITGFKYREKDYTKPGQFIDCIKIDNLSIPLNQGAYENGNPEVLSVEFITFDCSTEDSANINISIKLKNGERIDIIYNGKVSYDGLF